MKNLLKFCRKRSGASLVEYGAIAALIAVVALVSLAAFGNKVNGLMCQIIPTMTYLDKTFGGCTPTASQGVLTKLALPQYPTLTMVRDTCLTQKYVDYQDCTVQALEVGYPNPQRMLGLLGVQNVTNGMSFGAALNQVSNQCNGIWGVQPANNPTSPDWVECVATGQAAAAAVATGQGTYYDGTQVSNSTGSVTKWW